MTLNIDESLTAKGYTPAASVPQVYGRARTIESITIHHWGVNGQTHDGVVNFFVNGPGLTSAHFVASAGRVNCLVSPLDAAWHAGNPIGNASSIGIECRPEASDADYATVAELIKWLRDTYGDLPLIPHREWQATACPGIWDLARLDTLARTDNAPAPQPAPEPKDSSMKLFINKPVKTRPEIYMSNGLNYWHIPDPVALADYQRLAAWGVLDIFRGGEVQSYPAHVMGVEVK